MDVFTLLRNQFSNNSKSIVFLVALSSFIMIGLVVTSYITGISIMMFTRDPAAIAELPFYTGYFSQLAGVFWIICSTIALLTANVVNNKYKNFLLYSGLFTLFLGVDDLFLIHDGMFGQLGISGKVFYVLYAILSSIYFAAFYKIILKTPFVFLLITYGCLAFSVLADLVWISGINRYVFEDGFKIIGVISWMVYHFLVSKKLLVEKNTISEEKNDISSLVSRENIAGVLRKSK